MNRLMPFVFILVAIGIFFSYMKPTWEGQIATDNSQIASYNSALSAAAQFAANESKLEDERNAIPSDQMARLTAFVPDSVNNVQLILDLTALAARTGMTVSNFTTSATPNAPTTGGVSASTSEGDQTASGQPASPLGSLTLTLAATGTYNSFRSFLAGIEQSLRPLDVVSLSVNDSDTGVYTYQLTLQFYWLQ